MGFAKKKGAKRFTLLLLEDEEDYVADWVATCRWPSSVEGNWHKLQQLSGRLRLCTKSLFFDPDDLRVPIVRLPFAAMQRLEAADGARSFVLTVTAVTKMRANMEDAPYVADRGTPSTWGFTLAYAALDSFMPLAQEQLVVSRLPPPERTQLLAAAVRGREDAASFDSSRLLDFAERVLWEGPATQLTPLVREPGRLALSDQRLYFQPLHNVAGDVPVRSHPLAGVAAVARRRAALQPIGLELFFVHPDGAETAGGGSFPAGPMWEGPSAFFSFRTNADRERVLELISVQQSLGAAVRPAPTLSPTTTCSSSREVAGQLLEASGRWLNRVVVAWQRGAISNFDYLLYLNFAAGRSFNDLAQWPVVPWVLCDYTSASLDLSDPKHFRDLSKPVGALEPTRLEGFRQRYKELAAMKAATSSSNGAEGADNSGSGASGDMHPFLYGTHYSTPGYVMYWLVRAAPAHMLRLQAGRFDAPDRLFCSVADSWDSVLRSTTDVKELIPEFYMPGSDFLVNGARLALGVRQNGRPVGDVELPRWAASPDAFLATMRAALEAPPVSRCLHAWIDLVFGYKQSGPAAVEADNVFYHLTYEGAVDVGKVKDPLELKALELQINEFGQTPKQLFTYPHPPRHVVPPAPDPSTVFSAAGDTGGTAGKGRLRGGGEDAGGAALALALLSTIMAAAAPDIQAEAQRQHEQLSQQQQQRERLARQEHAAGLQPPAPQQHQATEAGAGVERLTLNTTEPSSPSSSSAGAPGPLRSVSPAVGGRDSPDSGSLSGRFKGYMSMFSESMGSASNAIRSRLSSSQVDIGTEAATPTAASDGAAARSTTCTAAAGAPDAAPAVKDAAPIAGAVPGASKLSLAWVHQQFARSPSPASGTAPVTSPDKGPEISSSNGPAEVAATSPPTAAGPATANTGAAAAAAAPAGPTPPQTPPKLQASAAPATWPRGLPERLLLRRATRLHKEPLTGVALSPALGGAAYCTSQDGLLRAMTLPDLTTHRQVKLAEELLCLCLLGPSSTGAAQSAGSSSRASLHHPLMLAGSHTGKVFAYSPDAGRQLGSWAAHEDAASCVVALGPGKTRIATGSWDCSVRLWDVDQGRQPWDSSLPMPLVTASDHESGVWALAASGSGQLLVSGTEEGVVAAWDVRSQQRVWAAQVSRDYVGGLCILPGGAHVAVASADGSISLLEWRRAGDVMVSVQCGAPLRCCAGDGRLLVAGTEGGQLQLWDVAQVLGQEVTAGFVPAGPDALYAPLRCESKAPVNAVAVGVLGDSCYAAAAQEDGTIALFST